jgi:predicted nuclease with RNAse H fold
VLTLGIDLASQPDRTAACTVAWQDGAARITHLSLGWDDAGLLDAIDGADRVGIDAPFGWPAPFVQAVAAPTWPADVPRASLVLRETDRWIHARTGKRPMSVSTDRIAYCAMRCAALLRGEPRDGSGRCVEAYPDAALRTWLPPEGRWTSYKRADGQARREHLVTDLFAGLGPAFDADGHVAACVASDDCLDALVCALVARAAALGGTHPPEDVPLARAEGWIHLPAMTLRALSDRSAAPARTPPRSPRTAA